MIISSHTYKISEIMAHSITWNRLPFTVLLTKQINYHKGFSIMENFLCFLIISIFLLRKAFRAWHFHTSVIACRSGVPFIASVFTHSECRAVAPRKCTSLQLSVWAKRAVLSLHRKGQWWHHQHECWWAEGVTWRHQVRPWIHYRVTSISEIEHWT